MGIHIMIRRLLDALFLTPENFATFQDGVERKAMVDIHMCVIPCWHITFSVMCSRLTYRRGLLRCSFRRHRAMRRLSDVGRVIGTDSHAFSYNVLIKIFYQTVLTRGNSKTHFTSWQYEKYKIFIKWLPIAALLFSSYPTQETNYHDSAQW